MQNNNQIFPSPALNSIESLENMTNSELFNQNEYWTMFNDSVALTIADALSNYDTPAQFITPNMSQSILQNSSMDINGYQQNSPQSIPDNPQYSTSSINNSGFFPCAKTSDNSISWNSVNEISPIINSPPNLKSSSIGLRRNTMTNSSHGNKSPRLHPYRRNTFVGSNFTDLEHAAQISPQMNNQSPLIDTFSFDNKNLDNSVLFSQNNLSNNIKRSKGFVKDEFQNQKEDDEKSEAGKKSLHSIKEKERRNEMRDQFMELNRMVSKYDIPLIRPTDTYGNGRTPSRLETLKATCIAISKLEGSNTHLELEIMRLRSKVFELETELSRK